jgi:hypothetical protein
MEPAMMDREQAKKAVTHPWAGVILALLGLGKGWLDLQKQEHQSRTAITAVALEHDKLVAQLIAALAAKNNAPPPAPPQPASAAMDFDGDGVAADPPAPVATASPMPVMADVPAAASQRMQATDPPNLPAPVPEAKGAADAPEQPAQEAAPEASALQKVNAAFDGDID